jgi:hypothetical protein
MIFGVAFFSFIMGNLTELIVEYDKKMGNIDRTGELHNWLN